MEFGDRVKDIVTGFEGVMLGRCEYMTGCTQVLVVPGVDKDGKRLDGEWFDVDRVTVVKAGAIKLTADAVAKPRRMATASSGADRPAPTK